MTNQDQKVKELMAEIALLRFLVLLISERTGFKPNFEEISEQLYLGDILNSHIWGGLDSTYGHSDVSTVIEKYKRDIRFIQDSQIP